MGQMCLGIYSFGAFISRQIFILSNILQASIFLFVSVSSFIDFIFFPNLAIIHFFQDWSPTDQSILSNGNWMYLVELEWKWARINKHLEFVESFINAY